MRMRIAKIREVDSTYGDQVQSNVAVRLGTSTTCCAGIPSWWLYHPNSRRSIMALRSIERLSRIERHTTYRAD